MTPRFCFLGHFHRRDRSRCRPSTVEVYHFFSEAAHLRSSIPHLKLILEGKKSASRSTIPCLKYTTKKYCSTRLKFRRFGVKEPSHFRKRFRKKLIPLWWHTSLCCAIVVHTWYAITQIPLGKPDLDRPQIIYIGDLPALKDLYDYR